MIPRLAQQFALKLHQRPRGRLLVLTGARQVGKSTLAKAAFPEYSYVDLDAPMDRERLSRLGPEDWAQRFPCAVVDEVQKMPELFDTLKARYDRDPMAKYVLLGSSQILLAKRLQETLAGRIALIEMFPLTLLELVAGPGGVLGESRMARLLGSDAPMDLLRKWEDPLFPSSRGFARATQEWDGLLRWGGMPFLQAQGNTEDDKAGWLADYQRTFLQRDLLDLSEHSRLEPFGRLQALAALRTSQTIQFSELGRGASISAPTVQKYLRYLELSYQALLLPPWFRNQEKRLSKMPKIHFLDIGILRSLTGKRGPVDGAEYESAVVAETIKLIRTLSLPIKPHFLRTSDGREVDLLLEREDGYFAIEIKMTARASPTDARHLLDLEGLLDKPLLASLVLSQDPDPKWFADRKTFAFPSAFLLACED